MSNQSSELEVNFRPETGKAVIEGKTVVPLQAFVTLILQRKVLNMLKTWGKHPVVVDSELLTSLASAPQDSKENRSNMILVSLGLGIFGGIGLYSAVQAGLYFLDIILGLKEHLIVAGTIISLGLVGLLMMKAQKMPRGEKLVETIEEMSSFLKK